MRWGVMDDSRCVLCGLNDENRGRLFFQCTFARNVCNAVPAKLDLPSHRASWDEEVDLAIKRFNGSDLHSRIGRLAIVITVYLIWMERNQLIFACKNMIDSVIVRRLRILL